MAPQVTSVQSKKDTPPKYLTRPQEIDWSSVNIGQFMTSNNQNPQEESMLRRWLNSRKEHNKPIFQELKEGKEALANVRHEIRELEREAIRTTIDEKKYACEEQVKALEKLEWNQIRKNIKLAFSLV